jgi:hypothetical protein
MNLYNYKLLSEIKTDAKNCVQSPDRPGFSLEVVQRMVQEKALGTHIHQQIICMN